MCSHHDEYTEQVGCQSRPRGICQCHDGAVDERLYLVVALTGNPQVVTLYLDFHAKTAESVGDDAQMLHGHVLDADAVAAHRCHADEGSYLNHVRENAVLGSM